jgi:hypothetical protein
MKPCILILMVKISIPKLPLGVTPMSEMFADLLGLITSMMLMSLLITTLNSWSWISDPPSIKVLLMKLGVFLIS